MHPMFAVTNTTRHSPKVPFARIKKAILGAPYELSLALVGDARARALNRTHKGKDTPTDVLSFPYERDSGEIIINVRRAARDARHYGNTHDEHIGFLFIHGCLHLAGERHGARMERKEDELFARFFPSRPSRSSR